MYINAPYRILTIIVLYIQCFAYHFYLSATQTFISQWHIHTFFTRAPAVQHAVNIMQCRIFTVLE